MTDTLAPVERTNWALLAWNSTLAQNDVPSAWMYGQDHLKLDKIISVYAIKNILLLLLYRAILSFKFDHFVVFAAPLLSRSFNISFGLIIL